MKLPISEEHLLKAHNPDLVEDEWPNFVLTQVTVYNEDNELTNLLLANETVPLTVTGRLDRLTKAEKHYLNKKDSLPAQVELNHVDYFAYGKYPDDTIAFWAKGKAGWFEIKPSRQYKALHQDMVEAIRILYFAADFYGNGKSRKKTQPDIELLFSLYAVEYLSDGEDELCARHTFRKHSTVLLQFMTQGKENVKWTTTDLFRFLQQQPGVPRSTLPFIDNNLIISIKDTVKSEPHSPSSKASLDAASDDVPITNPARLARKGKSALRLKSGKKARLIPNVDYDQDMPDLPIQPPSFHDEAVNGRAKKRIKSLQADDDDVSSAESVIGSSPSLPLRNGTLLERPYSHPAHSFKPVAQIVEEPLLSYEANGPGDSWICSFDGCLHKVYAASAPDSRIMIREHFRSHAYASQDQIDLAYQEERPYLPINNLLKKIREAAALQPPSATKEAVKPHEVFPQPIKQRY